MGAKAFELLQASSGVHIVVDDAGILQRDVSRYLRHLIKVKCLDWATVRNVGYVMKAWLNHHGDRCIYDVTDYQLIEYRDHLKSGNNQPVSINQSLSALCAYYWHAEKNKWCRGVIGSSDHHKKDDFFGITVDKPRLGSSSAYVIPFLLKVVKPPRARIPTSGQVAKFKDALADRALDGTNLLSEARNVRNQLMIRWMAEGALRCMEVVSLPVVDIPKEFPADSMVQVTLTKTKYMKIRDILVEASLIQETLDFINNERKVILRECNQGHDCDEIFVSTQKKQGAMTTKGVNELFRNVVTDLHPHALRRYALTRYAAYLYQIQQVRFRAGEIAQIDRRSIELELAQQAGHSNVSTTYRAYVDIAIAMVLSPAGERSLTELHTLNAMIIKKLEASEDLRKRV